MIDHPSIGRIQIERIAKPLIVAWWRMTAQRVVASRGVRSSSCASCVRISVHLSILLCHARQLLADLDLRAPGADLVVRRADLSAHPASCRACRSGSARPTEKEESPTSRTASARPLAAPRNNGASTAPACRLRPLEEPNAMHWMKVHGQVSLTNKEPLRVRRTPGDILQGCHAIRPDRIDYG